jgi:hypothetical protein
MLQASYYKRSFYFSPFLFERWLLPVGWHTFIQEQNQPEGSPSHKLNSSRCQVTYYLMKKKGKYSFRLPGEHTMPSSKEIWNWINFYNVPKL